MSSKLRLGQPVATRTSYLINSRTTKGEPVLKLDEDRDKAVDKNDPALVIRRQDDAGEWKWQPVTAPEQLDSYFESNQAKSQDVGLWKDRGFLGIFQGDGEVQDKEVEVLGDRWSEEKYEGQSTNWDSKYHQPNTWYNYYSSVDTSKVSVAESQTPGGTLTTLQEPHRISRIKEKFVTTWGLTGAGWRPYQTSTRNHTL